MNEEFPQLVREGSCVVTIYSTPNKGSPFYTLSFYKKGVRKRAVRADLKTARKEAKSIAQKLAKGDLEVMALRDQDRFIYLRALEWLKPFNLPLDMAAYQFAEAAKCLDGTSLVEAAKFYAENHSKNIQTKSVKEVVEELLKAKQEKQRSRFYVNDLRLRLGRFGQTFRCPISSVTPSDIDRFLGSLTVSGRTKNNFRRAIGTLFKFARTKGYVAKSHSGVSDVERANEEVRDIGIFTPAEMETLLQNADASLIPCLAISGFAGVRHEELKRLDWSDVKLMEGHIEIKGGKSKTRVRRLVPIPSNLRKWLLPLHRKEGAVVPFANLVNPLVRLAKQVGVEWKRNGLRHSFISYKIAQVRDVQSVALESGNSPGIIFRNYLKVVTQQQAESWFGIVPRANPNIVVLADTGAAG